MIPLGTIGCPCQEAASSAPAPPAFALGEENAEAVAAICRRIEGLPLSIELAAARVRLSSPKEMLPRQGDHEAARSYLTECLAVRREWKNRGAIAYCLDALGHVALVQSNYDEAIACFREARMIWTDVGNRVREAEMAAMEQSAERGVALGIRALFGTRRTG